VIINKILRDLINKGNIIAFVDNVLVGTEIEEGHDEIIEEILKRLEKNDLYICHKLHLVISPPNL